MRHHEGGRWLTFRCSVSSPRTSEQCRKERRPGAGAKASRRERARARCALELAAGWRGGRGPRWEGAPPAGEKAAVQVTSGGSNLLDSCGRGVRGCSVACNSVHLMDCSPPAPSVQGILQARILEWGAVSSCRGSSGPRDRTRACTGNLPLVPWATWAVLFL